MNTKNISLLTLIILGTITLTSCKKEDPVIPNQQELITTLTYTLTPVGGGTPAILKFQDLDGDGGNPPVYTVDKLAANTVYDAAIKLLDETTTPADNITEEVQNENDQHQFFFEVSNANAQIEYADEDVNGNPLGLASKVTTSAASTGTLTLVLRHQPNKPNDGTLADAGGETDIQVTFDLVIE